jgi:hypothetical protein
MRLFYFTDAIGVLMSSGKNEHVRSFNIEIEKKAGIHIFIK